MGDSPKTDHALTGGSLENPQHPASESAVSDGPAERQARGEQPSGAEATTPEQNPDPEAR